MAAVKVETKVGLLLSPEELFRKNLVLEMLHVTKSAKGIDTKQGELSNASVRKHFPTLPKEAADVLKKFFFETILEKEQTITKLLGSQNLSISPKLYVKNAMIKNMHASFDAAKPFAKLLRWYHKTTVPGTKTIKISPCHFSAYKPKLHFHVTNKENRLGLEIEIQLNGASYNLKEFTRYQFLLESNNEYFVLSHKDYQTLEWLGEHKPELYAHDGAAFAASILAKLEIDYPVNRNNLFTKKQIVVEPVNRIFLSELNNAFIMFTPQWLYDGFLVEGPYKDVFETTVNGEPVEIKRDKEKEDAFLELLVSLHANFPKQKNGYYYLSFADAQKKQWFLKAYHKLLELGIELIGMDMLQHFRYSAHKVETALNVKQEVKSKVMIDMKVTFGAEEIRLTELQKMLLAGQRAVLLKDGSLGILHDEWLQQYGAMIKHGKISKEGIEVSKFMAISQKQETEREGSLTHLIKENWWKKWKQWQNGEDIYEVPTSVNATLRPYQQKGFEWLTLLAEAGAGGCLADDMGLGKTLQTICFLAHHLHHNPKSVNIIVSPSSLIYNWQKELEKFTPGIKSVVYHGANRDREELNKEGVQVIITSYGTIRADAEALLAKQYGVAVIDESHNIKNPSAQITTIVGQIDADVRIALSGTPVVNNTFDLYAQLNFSLPGMFGSREFFKREYADAIDRFHDEEKIKALQKLTAPFILRRTKEQVAKDLPDKTESILWCKMKPEQQDLYNEIKEQIKSNIFLDIKSQGLNKSKLAVLQGMMKLRQICNSPLLLPNEEQQFCKQSIKTDVLLEELSNILKNHKALVFSQFSSMLDLLASDCEKAGIKYYHFDGQTPPAKRAEMVEAFQDKECDTNLFLISLKAGNAGLTLTAADYVFLFDPWWNTAVEQQAIDRTHRIGQTKNVFAYKIICKDTIEEKIIQLQQRKKQLADELVQEDEGLIKSLSEEDIEYLFS